MVLCKPALAFVFLATSILDLTASFRLRSEGVEVDEVAYIKSILSSGKKNNNQECDPSDIMCFGPSQSTRQCQSWMHGDPTFDDIKEENDKKNRALMAKQTTLLKKQGYYYHSKYTNVKVIEIENPKYFPKWVCEQPLCKDTEGERGNALLFLPPHTSSSTDLSKRILQVHGGSWWYGSPMGSDEYCSLMAQKLNMPVLAIDYTLAPVGHFNQILEQVGLATAWFATQDLHQYAFDTMVNIHNSERINQIADIYITGDSSGGGTALSALVAQASEKGLPGSNGFKLAGGSLLSPWINLISNSPSYFSQAYAKTPNSAIEVGDVIFYYENDDPIKYIQSSYDNGKDYAGDTPMDDPIANPIFAPKETLRNLVPVQILMGSSEFLQADAVIFAGRATSAGAEVEAHLYDGMWHTFPENFNECSNEKEDDVVLGKSALQNSFQFIDYLSKHDNKPKPKLPAYLNIHYEWPRKRDSVDYFHFDD